MILSDNWFGALINEAKNYIIFISMVASFLWCVFKTVAIKHPEIEDNKILTLWKTWIFGLPVVGSALSTVEKGETKTG